MLFDLRIQRICFSLTSTTEEKPNFLWMYCPVNSLPLGTEASEKIIRLHQEALSNFYMERSLHLCTIAEFMLRVAGQNKPMYLWKGHSMDIHLPGIGQLDKNLRSLVQNTSTLLLSEVVCTCHSFLKAYPLLPNQGA